MPPRNKSSPTHIRLRVSPLPQVPATCGVKLSPVRPAQNSSLNNRHFSPTHDFILAQLWTRHIFTVTPIPTSTLNFETNAAQILSFLNPQKNTHTFTPIQVRIRLNHLVQHYSSALDNALSTRPKPITVPAFSKFHVFYPFLACEKPVLVSTISDRGRKPWPGASNHLSINIPRHPILSAAPIPFHPVPSSSPPPSSSAFNVLDDILLLQYWHSNILHNDAPSTPLQLSNISTPLLQSLHTVHRITHRHPRPNFTPHDLHRRLHFLLVNYVNVLTRFDRAPARHLAITHTAFLHFAVVYRFLQGCRVQIHGSHQTRATVDLIELAPSQRSRALRAARRNRLREMKEQSVQESRPEQTGDAAAAEIEPQVEQEQVESGRRHEVEVTAHGSKAVTADTTTEWEEDMEVVRADEASEEKIEPVDDQEVILVREDFARDDLNVHDRRRRILQSSVELAELDLKRHILAVKRHELILKREKLELECSEMEMKRRRVEREQVDEWKWDKLKEFADAIEKVKGNEVLESIAQTLIGQFKSEIEDGK